MADGESRSASPLVVKIGGSLAETGRMASVLDLITEARIPIVIVPGGGPFADAIRDLQPVMNYSDAVAHRMAMLAMQQMAELMLAQQSRLEIVETLDEIMRTLKSGRIPVWAPLHMIAADTAIPANWSATSDSLAGRLAETLGARLVLIKSVDVEPGVELAELARRGVVDPVLPSIVARSRLSWSIFGPADAAALRACLEDQGES